MDISSCLKIVGKSLGCEEPDLGVGGGGRGGGEGEKREKGYDVESRTK